MASGSTDPESSTVALLRSLDVGPDDTVPLRRVVQQRITFARLGAGALVHPSLDSVLEEACRSAALGCDVRYAKVLQHRAEDHVFMVRAGWGWKPGVVGRVRFCDDPTNPAGQAFHTRKTVTVPDVRVRGDYHLPPVYADHGIVSSANVPIIGASGFFGVLEVDHPAPRRFDALDSTFLISIAGIIAEAVSRVKRETALRAAHNATAALLREHYHRVRNDFQTILGLVQLHARDATTDNSRQRIQDIGRRIFSLSALYDHLLGRDIAARIEVREYILALCDRLRDFYNLDQRPIALDCDLVEIPVSLDVDTCATLGIIINELVANALEHAFDGPGGRIAIVLRPADGGGLTLHVEDNGRGFQGAAPGSVGLSVARRLASWVGGSLTMDSAPDRGTRWVLSVARERLRPRGSGAPS